MQCNAVRLSPAAVQNMHSLNYNYIAIARAAVAQPNVQISHVTCVLISHVTCVLLVG